MNPPESKTNSESTSKPTYPEWLSSKRFNRDFGDFACSRSWYKHLTKERSDPKNLFHMMPIYGKAPGKLGLRHVDDRVHWFFIDGGHTPCDYIRKPLGAIMEKYPINFDRSIHRSGGGFANKSAKWSDPDDIQFQEAWKNAKCIAEEMCRLDLDPVNLPKGSIRSEDSDTETSEEDDPDLKREKEEEEED